MDCSQAKHGQETGPDNSQDLVKGLTVDQHREELSNAFSCNVGTIFVLDVLVDGSIVSTVTAVITTVITATFWFFGVQFENECVPLIIIANRLVVGVRHDEVNSIFYFWVTHISSIERGTI